MNKFSVIFEYCEITNKWEVIVKGASSSLEALQGFNAVILTCRETIPSLECNKAALVEDGIYKISIGIIPDSHN